MDSLLLAFHLNIERVTTPTAPAHPSPFAARGHFTQGAWRLTGQSWRGHLTSFGSTDGEQSVAVTADGTTAVLLCGEIYNRAELQLALHTDIGQATDAQLLLACFTRYGKHAFRLLNGRFAAVVGSGAAVHLATDHAGSVPLYLADVPLGIAVSTEVKTLAPVAGPKGSGVCSLQELPSVRGMRASRVPAGAVVTWNLDRPGTASIAHTWAPPLHREILDENSAATRIRADLTQAVTRRTQRADGLPIAVLSGGIDSSTIAVLAAARCGGIRTITMGTADENEFIAADNVATYLKRSYPAADHTEITCTTEELLANLPWAVWASEMDNAAIVEYLLPLVTLYRRLDGPARLILTGYGADIPLAGMHRDSHDLVSAEDSIVHDMATFDGLNELSPTLASLAGHWTSHPFWDREVLDTLVALEVGLKRRYGRDKWALREAMADLLPASTIHRPKIGVHEGSGVAASFRAVLHANGVAPVDVDNAKSSVIGAIYDQVIPGGRHPAEVDALSVIEQRPWRTGRALSR